MIKLRPAQKCGPRFSDTTPESNVGKDRNAAPLLPMSLFRGADAVNDKHGLKKRERLQI
jgi:hypothetical protein